MSNLVSDIKNANANALQNLLLEYKWMAYSAIGLLFIGGCFLAYNKYIENKKIQLELVINRHVLDEYRTKNTEDENKRIENSVNKVEKYGNKIFGEV